jgi:glycosyltransferase involved in cell wall biosynthesis
LKAPHVTICVPAYNAARTISRTLDSILAQDYSNYDVIVCDNLSSDDTSGIVKTYEDRGVRYFLNPVQERCGESNWNQALSLAEGPLIALYHADDLYTSTMVRRQVEFLVKHPEASAVFTMTQRIDEYDRPIKMGNTKLPKELRGKEIFNYEEFLNYTLKYTTFVVVPTMMSKRELIDRVGVFNWDKYATASDIDLYLRMAKHGPIGVIDEPLHKYRISSLQGSELIARNRITLFDFFHVMDVYLSNPKEKQVAQPQSLTFYELNRFSNLLTCTMNLLAQGNRIEARVRLHDALRWKCKHFAAAFKRPRFFMRLIVAVGFFVCIYLWLGGFVGRKARQLNICINKWRRMPIKDKKIN